MKIVKGLKQRQMHLKRNTEGADRLTRNRDTFSTGERMFTCG